MEQNQKLKMVATLIQGQVGIQRNLEYFDQIKFLNAQRSLLNFIESFPMLIIFTIVSGLYFPIPSLVGVWLNLLGRIIFIAGYNRGA